MNLRADIESRIAAALSEASGLDDAQALVAPSSKPQFGDYQANGVMAAAKRMGAKPRELAEKVIAALDLSDLAEKVDIAGPGFINVTLKKDLLAKLATEALADEHLGVARPATPQTVVVDYSSPNLAKEMHVGHLRSTIIGDALTRTLTFMGHKVKRQNHVGDWGTQFGMLTAYLDVLEAKAVADAPGDVITRVALIQDLEEFYRQAKKLFDTNEEFAQRSRDYVVKLQSGDPEVRRTWGHYRDMSLDHCNQVYDTLNVLLEGADVRGESDYNDDLPGIVEDLRAGGLLTESQGAQCVFLDQFKGKDDEPLPVIVQKSDGGYLYATTDLAAMRYRVGELHADRVLYVTDSRQAQHFDMVFAVARAAGFMAEDVSLEHVGFGMMLDPSRRPFKTREGGTVKLMDLLAEAEQRAMELVAEKNPDLSADDKQRIARVVGIGAVKYADLCHNRASDYVFSWEKMLALEGNTAPYMQYAYARIKSIFRKGGLAESDLGGEIALAQPAERALAVKLAQFSEAVEAVATDCMPNILCAYLFDLAGAFMSFYESCPVIQAQSPAIRASRLQLCQLTARTIHTALDLLGIETIEQM